MTRTIRAYSHVWLWADDMRLAALAMRLRDGLRDRQDKREWRQRMRQAKRVSRAYQTARIRL